jgi:hypothetical protein
VNGKWVFLDSIGKIVKLFIPKYFNFVLVDGYSMMVDGMECITLAHRLRDNNGVSHDYIGPQAILDNLITMNGWPLGRINIVRFQLDSMSLRVIKVLAPMV